MADCLGKRAFPTGALARRAIQGIRSFGDRTEAGTKPVRAYPCKKCRKFHLTSMWEPVEDEA
jgi:hypothetical protein